jgi:hypothetical protein
MSELPQIVREGLKRKQTETAGDHPDANLLSAFAEHTLTGSERANVLEHLAHCSACREVVALASPELGDEPKVVSALPSGSRSWWRSPVIHWGALTAAALVVLIAVGERMRLREGHSASAPAVVQETIQNSGEVTHDAPAAPPQTSQSAQESTPSPRITARADENGKPNATEPNPSIVSKNGASLSAEAKGTASAPFSGNAGSIVGGTGSGTGGGVGAGRLAAPTGAPASTEARNISPAAPPSDVNKSSGKDEVRKFDYLQPSESTVVVSRAEAVEQAPAAGSLKTKKADPAATAQFSTSAKQVSVATRWSISNSGVLQRSVDGGRTWQPIVVADGITFRTVAAIANEVWAGGSAGALFHSADAGEHWSQVPVQADGRVLSEDIVRIDFNDYKNGTLITSTGQTWSTSDSGAHWR